uniref:Uncharacterized protein n=1 Tax=viral metagenome TaxID=1070528 RepID=A0A6C0BKZ5_9ZZZZ
MNLINQSIPGELLRTDNASRSIDLIIVSLRNESLYLSGSNIPTHLDLINLDSQSCYA